MIIFPAIDLLDGQCVRLYKGEYQKSTVVAEDACKTALSFKEAGATHLHMVDLNGAKSGSPVNQSIIQQVVKTSGLKVQVGGGIRNLATAERYLNAGAHRIIIGSAALTDPGFVKTAVKRFGSEHVAVGIDAKNGMVMTEGWLASGGVTFLQLAQRMEEEGVCYFIVTDIDRDGTLGGISRQMLADIHSATHAHIIASGGVRGIEDITAAMDMGLYGTICGKALYSGDLDLAQAVALAGKQA